MTPSLLVRVNDGIYALHDLAGLHVGNLKWISGHWKFKAIGYGSKGEVIPGGGPLTDRHNTPFTQLDEATIRTHFFKE